MNRTIALGNLALLLVASTACTKSKQQPNDPSQFVQPGKGTSSAGSEPTGQARRNENDEQGAQRKQEGQSKSPTAGNALGASKGTDEDFRNFRVAITTGPLLVVSSRSSPGFASTSIAGWQVSGHIGWSAERPREDEATVASTNGPAQTERPHLFAIFGTLTYARLSPSTARVEETFGGIERSKETNGQPTNGSNLLVRSSTPYLVDVGLTMRWHPPISGHWLYIEATAGVSFTSVVRMRRFPRLAREDSVTDRNDVPDQFGGIGGIGLGVRWPCSYVDPKPANGKQSEDRICATLSIVPTARLLSNEAFVSIPIQAGFVY